jgi:hypothetical protein
MYSLSDVVAIMKEEKDGRGLESVFGSKKELRKGGGGGGGGEDGGMEAAN